MLVAHARDRRSITASDLNAAGRDDCAAQGGAQAQSRADAGRFARARARRPVRQYRARLQLRSSRRERGSNSPTTSSPRRASAPISARRNSSTSSAARRGSSRRRRCSSPRCARSRCMAASPRTRSAAENLPALEAGLANLARHVANLRKFGLPVTVAVNRFDTDTAAELAFVENAVAREFGGQDRSCAIIGLAAARARKVSLTSSRLWRTPAKRSSGRSTPMT